MEIILNSELIAKISTFPPDELIKHRIIENKKGRVGLTDHQRDEWVSLKNRWYILAKQIDYIQHTEYGLISKSPLDDPCLHPALKVMLKIESDLLFARLKLMIRGWELIKKAAFENQRVFNFKNPRELFVESCRQEAESATEDFLSTEINQGSTLELFRDYYRQTSAFYQSKLEGDKHDHMLKIHQDCKHWFRFVIYAIWKERNNQKFNEGKLSEAWSLFLKAYKAQTKSICDKNFYKEYDTKLFMAKWNQGYPVFANTCRSVPLS